MTLTHWVTGLSRVCGGDPWKGGFFQADIESFPRMRGGTLTVETVELGFDVLPAYDVGDPEGSETV